MPTEPTGPGFQSPPAAGESVPGEERLRAVEDFLSRRVKVMVETTADFPITVAGFQSVPFGRSEYDTSGFWDGNKSLIVPRGAEGDYLIIATLRASPDDYQEASISIPGVSYAKNAIKAPAIDVKYQVVSTATLIPGDVVNLSVRRLTTADSPTVLSGTIFEMRRLV